MKQNFKIPVYAHGVTMNEIPDKISLVITLGKCECHCKGCHSDYLWDTHACEEQTPEELLSLIKSYRVSPIRYSLWEETKIIWTLRSLLRMS